MSDPSETPADPFADVGVEGPFGFKPDRNRPIEPHFDGFGRLTPDQARQVLDVRDGRVPRCLLQLPTEHVLVEHTGQGYCDPTTGVPWGYSVRRVGVAAPPSAPPEPAPPADAPLDRSATPVVAVTPEVRPLRQTPALTPASQTVAKPAVFDRDRPADEDVEADVDSGVWAAPARSPLVVTMADPAERTALVRVLILWFVVALLAAECAAVLAGGR